MLLTVEHRLETARSLGLDHVAAEVSAALRRADIPVVLLKGAALATWLYDDGAVRPYGDIDLLVAPAEHSRAEAVLVSLGFDDWRLGLSPLEAAAHAREWARDGVYVDLHHSLWGVGLDPALAWLLLVEGTETLAVGGGQLSVLGRPAQALHVALHAAQHGPRHPKPAQDLARALTRLPIDTWQQAAALAGRLGAAEAMGAGLRLAAGGPDLAARLGLPSRAPLVVEVSATSRARGAKALAKVIATPGIGPKSVRAARLAVPSCSLVRLSVPFAARSRAGLAVGYVWLVLSRIRRLPRAAVGVARVSLENRR